MGHLEANKECLDVSSVGGREETGSPRTTFFLLQKVSANTIREPSVEQWLFRPKSPSSSRLCQVLSSHARAVPWGPWAAGQPTNLPTVMDVHGDQLY
jgi:hypothetical protein